MWHFFIWGVTEQWSANQFYFCVLQSKSCNILKLCPYWVLKRMICPTSNSYTRLNSLKKYPTTTCCPSLYNISHNIHWYSFMKKYPTAMTCRTSLYNISHNIHWYSFMKSNQKRRVVLPSITLDTISIGIHLCKSIQKGRHAALLPIRIFSCTNLGTCVVLTFPRTVYGTVFALPRLLYIFCCAQPRIASNNIKISWCPFTMCSLNSF